MALPPNATPPSSPASPPPAAAGGADQKTPPFGSSPAVTPNANQGLQVAGMNKVATALKFLVEALNVYGPMSDEGQAIVKAIGPLGKLAQPGAVSPAAEANQLQSAQLKNAQNSSMMAATKASMSQPPGGGAPGGAPPQAPPTPPQGM